MKPARNPIRHGRPLRLSSLLLASAALLPAQRTLTSVQADGIGSAPSIFEASSRTQQFLAPAALRPPGADGLLLRGLWLRYDGPTQTTTGSPHVLQQLTIRVGATSRSVQEVGATFADNLSTPLKTVFSAANYAIPLDLTTSQSPQAWGGPGNQLYFPFEAPIRVNVPTRGSLCIEFEVQADPAHAPADTRLDFDSDPLAGVVGGMAYSQGLSCGYPANMPTVTTEGTYGIGTAFGVSGAGFTPNMPVATWMTALLGAQTTIPGTGNCWSYLNLDSGGILSVGFTDAAGSFGGGDPPVPIPPSPGLCGSRLYLQSAGMTQPSAINQIGVETSNYRTIVIGCRKRRVRGWYVSQTGSWSDRIASTSRAGSLSIRLR